MTAEVDHGLGRSRGGFSSKIHVVCDGYGNPLGAVISGGHRNDAALFEQTLKSVSIPQRRGRPKTKPNAVIADKGYDFSPVRKYLQGRNIKAVIPSRKMPDHWKCHKRGPKPKTNFKIYKERNVVERLIGWVKNCRRIATRFEKYAHSFLSMVKLAFIKFFLKKYF
ncbi:MAG: IS5 family transposase, partial [Flavobacteriales bacterium]